jgi:hypothetical protein
MKKCVDYRINLYTLANEPQINIQCHIRPVIKIENVRLYLREYNESEPVLYKRLEIEDYHGRFNRCVDIAWLDVK